MRHSLSYRGSFVVQRSCHANVAHDLPDVLGMPSEGSPIFCGSRKVQLRPLLWACLTKVKNLRRREWFKVPIAKDAVIYKSDHQEKSQLIRVWGIMIRLRINSLSQWRVGESAMCDWYKNYLLALIKYKFRWPTLYN